MELIPEIKDIMKECAHFAKIGSCYGCSDVKCVHGRYIGLILTGLAAAKEENIARAAEVEKAMYEIMGLAGKPFSSPEPVCVGEASVFTPDQIKEMAKTLKKAGKKFKRKAIIGGSNRQKIHWSNGDFENFNTDVKVTDIKNKKTKATLKKIAKDAAVTGTGVCTIDFKSGKAVIERIKPEMFKGSKEEVYKGISRREMQECIQMETGEYNSFDFKKAPLPEIYEIYKKECLK